ncbi:hypothetical protein QUB63_17295 [Microcoleus sp. ARI1-B5]
MLKEEVISPAVISHQSSGRRKKSSVGPSSVLPSLVSLDDRTPIALLG